MGILYPHIGDAVRNARKLRANHTKAGNGQPRTDCDLLVNALGAQTREDVPPFEVQPEDPGELSMYWT